MTVIACRGFSSLIRDFVADCAGESCVAYVGDSAYVQAGSGCTPGEGETCASGELWGCAAHATATRLPS